MTPDERPRGEQTSPQPPIASADVQRLEMHIDELVLHGFGHYNRDRVSEAMQRELTRLLTLHGIHPSLMRGGEIGQTAVDAIAVAPDATPEVVGVQVAHAIYGGLRR